MANQPNEGARLVALFLDLFEPDPVSEDALRLAGRHLDRAAELDAAVARHGVLLEGTRGTWVINPAVEAARRERQAAYAITRDVFPDDGPDDAATSADRSAAGRAMARARWGVRGGMAA